jgi:hypothetical protein
MIPRRSPSADQAQEIRQKQQKLQAKLQLLQEMGLPQTYEQETKDVDAGALCQRCMLCGCNGMTPNTSVMTCALCGTKAGETQCARHDTVPEVKDRATRQLGQAQSRGLSGMLSGGCARRFTQSSSPPRLPGHLQSVEAKQLEDIRRKVSTK